MTALIFSAVTSFAIAFLILPVIIKYSLRKNLVDIPGRRKIHKKLSPTLGGVAIFVGFIVALMMWADSTLLIQLRYVIISLLIMFTMGVRDDLISLRPWMKLIAQAFVALILIVFFDLRIYSLYGILGIYTIPTYASYAATILTVIVIVNSFNLIDGLDGLAGTLATVSLFSFGVWFYLAGDLTFSTLSFALLGGLLAFLLYNWEPSQIFMGDSGAQVIGLLVAIVTIHFINYNYALPGDSEFRFQGSVGTGICFIVVPLVDTLRVFLLRILRGQSPFTPDKSHVHHCILRLGASHARTTVILSAIQLLFILAAIALSRVPDNYLVLIIALVGTVLSLILDRLIRARVDA